MARYRHYDPEQTQMIAVAYGRQLLPRTFEHALSYLIDNEIDLGRFAARFKNEETGAPTYNPTVLLEVVLFAYSRGITSSRTMQSSGGHTRLGTISCRGGDYLRTLLTQGARSSLQRAKAVSLKKATPEQVWIRSLSRRLPDRPGENLTDCPAVITCFG
jgi:hypothetical protein